MKCALFVDAVLVWCNQSPLVREIERLWFRSRLWRLTGARWQQERVGRYRRHHLYEMVISNGRLWLKLQAPCWSSLQAAWFLEGCFNGTQYIPADGHRPVTPFRLSDCSHKIANWESVADQLPEEWDDGEYSIERYPYAWCETLSKSCGCNADNENLSVVCSDYGTSQEKDKKLSKTGNVWHDHYIKGLEASIVNRDEARRRERSGSAPGQSRSGSDGAFVYPRVAVGQGAELPHVDVPIAAMNTIGQMVAAKYYCSIDKSHHPYGDQPIRRTVASLNAACEKMTALDDVARRSNMSHMVSVAEHYLKQFQAEECARKAAWGDAEIPKVLYKYIPLKLIGKGAPNSLRATQLLALNDDMECNVITMKDVKQSKLEMLRTLRDILKDHLGIDIPWEDLLEESLYHGLRLSPYIQRYLDDLVGVVAFSTDIFVPTMWAHYARNTGIAVGYDTEILRTFGFELQPVIYSEIAPIYRPLTSDHIELEFVDREYMEMLERTGQKKDGLTVLTTAKLATLGSDWKSLSRILFVKGMSWAYEKEVRLLVDLKQTRDTGKSHDEWPIKVIDLPPAAIVEIYGGANTREADIERAVRAARGGDKSGLLVGRLSSHAFRIQKRYGMRH